MSSMSVAHQFDPIPVAQHVRQAAFARSQRRLHASLAASLA